MPMPSSEIMFWKRALHKCVQVYVYIPTVESLFQDIVLDLGTWHSKPSFLNGAHRVLEKRSSYAYACTYIFVYITIYIYRYLYMYVHT